MILAAMHAFFQDGGYSRRFWLAFSRARWVCLFICNRIAFANGFCFPPYDGDKRLSVSYLEGNNPARTLDGRINVATVSARVKRACGNEPEK